MKTALKIFGWTSIVFGALAFAGAQGEAVILVGAIYQFAFGLVAVKYVKRQEQANEIV